MLFKIVLVGNAGVGKTCLVRQFTTGKYPTRQGATIGVDFLIKPMDVKGVRVNLQLWDTAGQERFRAITQSYYRSAHCLVLVYDISNQPSFDSLSQWVRDIDQYTGAMGNNNTATGGTSSSVLRVLVGNKCDKEREIPEAIGQKFAENNGFDFFLETSALHLANVDRLFNEIAAILVERKLATMSKEQSANRGLSLKALLDGDQEDDEEGEGGKNGLMTTRKKLMACCSN